MAYTIGGFVGPIMAGYITENIGYHAMGTTLGEILWK